MPILLLTAVIRPLPLEGWLVVVSVSAVPLALLVRELRRTPLRWPRMTTRRWMVAVVAVGVILVFGLELLTFTPTGQERLRKAAFHAEQAELARSHAREYSMLVDFNEVNLSVNRHLATMFNEDAVYHDQMKGCYEVSARRIWELEPEAPPAP